MIGLRDSCSSRGLLFILQEFDSVIAYNHIIKLMNILKERFIISEDRNATDLNKK